jgi:5-methyltetrahydropteroyltriglutamate--homocysteine methyltransferase
MPYTNMRSTERILTTHAGALPRPKALRELILARSRGETVDEAALDDRLKAAVAETVARQARCGLDSLNDGELSKSSFTEYARARIGGCEMLPAAEGRRLDITARDRTKFADYFQARPVPWLHTAQPTRPICTAPLRYAGGTDLARDLANFTAALAGAPVAEAFLSSASPGAIEHWMTNRHYRNDEEFLFAIGEAMREEYRAIIDAGALLQIDAPDLLDAWNCLPEMTVPAYRAYAALRVEALNHALRGLPRDKIRVHVCWGSFHGPHHDDIPLRDVVDIIFAVAAGSYSIEGANPCHEHEWRVLETVKPPSGTTFVPGVVGHCSDFIEHPDLVAERLVRYAKLLGRETVIAGTDCGLGPRVGHPSICWAKFEALAEGARRASKILWGGS